MTERDRRSSRRRFLQTAFLGTVLGTTGCLRFAGGGNQTTEPPTTEVETTRDPTPRPTPTDTATQAPTATATATPASQPDGATFRFDYVPDSQQVVVRYAGGGRLRAGSIEIRSSNGKSVGWSDLGSTLAGPGEVLEQGATARLGPTILNWGRRLTTGETIRVVFVGEGSPATLGRFTVPDTTTPTEPPAETPTETPGDSETATPTETTATPVDSFSFSETRLATRDGESYVATLPSVWFYSNGQKQSMEIDGSNAFRIRNTDAGKRVRVSIDDGQSVEARNLAFEVYSRLGKLDSSPEVTATVANTDEYRLKRLSASVEGDADTFSAETFASYRVTMFENGQALDATETQRFPVGHRKESDVTVGDTITWSFNAGDIPGDALEDCWIRTQDDTDENPPADSKRYDESANRFVASVDASKVPDGVHEAVMRCRDPDSRVYLARLATTFTA